MADDEHLGARLLAQALRKLVEDRAQPRLKVGAAGLERDVVRDVQLQLVVGRLRDLHPGAGGGLLHLHALVFHVTRPGVAARRADGSTNGGALAVANQSASHGAHASTDAGVALRFGHVGAAGGQQRGRGGGNEQATA